MSIFHDQAEFMKAAGKCTPEPEGSYRKEEELLAQTLIEEEYRELGNEDFYYQTNSPDAIKEALDLIYVTAQYLNVTIGPDKAKECWNALQENNMSKCIDGKLVKRADGKVLKPEGYVKLDLGEILDRD